MPGDKPGFFETFTRPNIFSGTAGIRIPAVLPAEIDEVANDFNPVTLFPVWRGDQHTNIIILPPANNGGIYSKADEVAFFLKKEYLLSPDILANFFGIVKDFLVDRDDLSFIRQFSPPDGEFWWSADECGSVVFSKKVSGCG